MVVVGPLPAAGELSRELRTEAELMDLVGHGVLVLRGRARHEVVLEIVGMHVHVGETATRGDVEVAHHLVHSKDTLNSAAFPALRLEFLSVAFPFTLLDIGSDTKGPLLSGICFPDFIASTAASGLDGILWRRCSIAITTVVRVKVCSGVCGGVPGREVGVKLKIGFR